MRIITNYTRDKAKRFARGSTRLDLNKQTDIDSAFNLKNILPKIIR